MPEAIDYHRAAMSFLPRFLRGGRDELGFDDLVHRVVDAIAAHGHRESRGRIVFPAAITVRIEVPAASGEVVRGFVGSPGFDERVVATLANRSDREPGDLPEREYLVEAAETIRIAADAAIPRGYRLRIAGGDRDGAVIDLAPASAEIRFGRGPHHGGDRSLMNDVVVCDAIESVSRRAGRIVFVGSRLEIESLDQGDGLVVRRPRGEAVRPARTARGRVALGEGDVIELPDVRGGGIRIAIERIARSGAG